MEISLYLMLALLVVLAVGWWFQRRHVTQKAQTVTEQAHYHAVMIVPGSHPCSAVHEFSGRRLLAQKAPLLPLTSCDNANCQCTYYHLKDRRQLKERRWRHIDKRHEQSEKRHGNNRRHHSLR